MSSGFAVVVVKSLTKCCDCFFCLLLFLQSYEEYVEIHSRCMRQLGLPVIPQSHATQEPSSKTDDGSNGSSKDRSSSRKRGRDSS